MRTSLRWIGLVVAAVAIMSATVWLISKGRGAGRTAGAALPAGAKRVGDADTASPSPGTPPLPATTMTAHSTAETASLKFNYRVPGKVPLLKQDRKKGCWATAATMLYGWKERRDVAISEFLMTLGGGWSAIYADGDRRGLLRSEKRQFLDAVGLRFEWGASYAVNGLQNLLEEHGPLWFTVNNDAFNTHATVVIGVVGSGEMSDTYVVYIDPADGMEHRELYPAFMKRYEDVAYGENAENEGDSNAVYTVQVVHY